MSLEKNLHEAPLSQKIAQYLQEKITEGTYPVGSKLPTERDLAKMFGVSRLPVREALKTMSQLGIIQTVHGSGNYVQDRTANGLEQVLEMYLQMHQTGLIDLLQIRRIVEQGALSLTLKKIRRKNSKLLYELDTLKEFCLSCLAGHTAKRWDDLTFHTRLCLLSENTLIIRLISSIHSNLLPIQNTILEHDDLRHNMMLEHYSIIEAMQSNNGVKALQLLDRHLVYEQSFLLKARNNPDSPTEKPPPHPKTQRSFD